MRISREFLHAHTDRSDGLDTLETMAEALSRGYQYFGVADHSKSAHYAGGPAPLQRRRLTSAGVRRRHCEAGRSAQD
jgi:histidinol phosphatase-like PHP family hydrolase